MLRKALLVVSLLTSLLSTPAVAREIITDFHSDISVQENRVLSVIETISVIAENLSIRSGIYRDLPTTYPHPKWGYLGIREKTHFEIQSITLDGTPSPWHQVSLANGIRIYIGDQNSYVAPGPHTYRIHYQTTNQLSTDNQTDKQWLHWNVNGQDWQFATNALSATVHLPNDARPVFYDASLGKSGNTEKSFKVTEQADGATRFDATRALLPYEGMTISLELPKGLIQVAENGTANLLMDNIKWLLGIGLLFLLPIYYFKAWLEVGRDPQKGVVVADYHPVRNLSPAAHHFITQNKSNNQTFAVAILNMAVKGYIKIEQHDKKSYTLFTTETDNKNTRALSAGEQIVYAALFSGADSIELGKTYNKDVASAKTKLKQFLKKEWRDASYQNNQHYTWIGLLIGLSALALCALHLSNAELTFSHLVPLFIFGTVSLGVVARSFKPTFLIGAVVFIFVGLQDSAVSLFNSSAMIWLSLFVAALFLLFYYLLKAPTPFGQKLLDEMEGFRLYLATAEQNRLNILHPPEKTPELFEKLLPYALALQVENQWGEQFSDMFRQHAEQDGQYQPSWYQGNQYRGFSGSNIGAALGAGLTSSVASASTAPSSSSSGGFSGGAGGGGGGGGGGGW